MSYGPGRLQDPEKRPIRPIERLTFEGCPLITLWVRLSVRPWSVSKMAIALIPLGIYSYVWHADRYRQDLVNKLAKCEFSLTEAKPRQTKMWKFENNHNAWTVWNILIIFSRTDWYRQDLAKCLLLSARGWADKKNQFNSSMIKVCHFSQFTNV